MAAFMALAGKLGALATVIETLRDVLKGAGIAPEDITRIIRELMKRLWGGKADPVDGGPLPAPWEYSTVALAERKSWGRAKGLIPVLRDGLAIPPTELAAYLNQVSVEGWEILSAVGSEKSPTLILTRAIPAR